MEKDVLIVSGPSILPPGVHDKVVTDIARVHRLVLLLKFGDEEYNFSNDYLLPLNCRIMPYSYETLDVTIKDIQLYLESFGVDVVSRHHSGMPPLPFILTGSILKVPKHVTLDFYREDPVEATTVRESEYL